jgi:hypothetical protein
MAFVFHEQETNSSNQQTDYLICHLVQEQGQKKSLDEIKASLKQTVQVPKDFTGLGTQLQLFATALSIFFGNESICTEKLNKLLLLVGRNKKPIHQKQHHVPYSLAISLNGTFLLILRIASMLWAFQYVF